MLHPGQVIMPNICCDKYREGDDRRAGRIIVLRTAYLKRHQQKESNREYSLATEYMYIFSKYRGKSNSFGNNILFKREIYRYF